MTTLFYQSQNKNITDRKRDGGIIYADLGVMPRGARPTAAPPVNSNKIIYASVQQRTTKM